MDTPSANYITGNPAFAVDRQGAIVSWNQAAEEALGVDATGALGQKCWTLLAGKDIFGNRHCCEHCPIREMAFEHEPVRSFHCAFKTSDHGTESFGISCVVIQDQPGHEILLHICHPDGEQPQVSTEQLMTTGPVENLSRREHEILVMLADKVKTIEIAERLGISIRTVRTHIQHLMYKLHVHKRAEAVKVGKKLELI
jgi:LuxR family maltose regulon positive regulatory protein